MLQSVLAISLGASLGALSRWGLGALLNAFFPLLPLGTVCANLLGGYLVGFSLTFFASAGTGINQDWRLFIITGFLGALTTFSTFSAEVVTLLQQQRLGLALGTIALHVCGSLLMTFLGIATFNWVK